MTRITVAGDGGLGIATAAAFRERGADVRVLGRPADGRHRPAAFDGSDVVVEASRGDAVVGNVSAALEGGCRRLVVATTGWGAGRPTVERLLDEYGASAVVAPNFSLGVVLFGRLVDEAVRLFGHLDAFDPYLVEWHRRTKADRPSGTANALAERIVAGHPAKRAIADGAAPPGRAELEVVSIRAGASPGMHLVGFDAPGETVELRLTARDRSAYAAGIVAAADWLLERPRPAGAHPFDAVVDDLLATATATSTDPVPVTA